MPTIYLTPIVCYLPVTNMVIARGMFPVLSHNENSSDLCQKSCPSVLLQVRFDKNNWVYIHRSIFQATADLRS